MRLHCKQYYSSAQELEWTRLSHFLNTQETTEIDWSTGLVLATALMAVLDIQSVMVFIISSVKSYFSLPTRKVPSLQ